MLLLLAVCLIAAQVRDLLSYSQWYTDEDQTLLWYAGQALIHFHMYSPNVLGSNYNTVFEAAPGALLHLLGVTLRLAIPLGVAVMVTLCWGVPSAAAWIRGYRTSAVLALAIPVTLTFPYLLLADQTRGVLTGDLAAALAIAFSVGVRRPLLRSSLVILFTGVGFAWDNGSFVASAPALLATVAADFRTLKATWARALQAAALGASISVALLIFQHFWYAAHPGYIVSPPIPVSPHLSVLWGHITHPGPLFGFYAPELLRLGGWIALVGLLAILALAVYAWRASRRAEPIAAAVGFAGVLVVTLTVGDTGWNYKPDLYLNGARFLLMMPLGAWVVAHWSLVAWRTRVPRSLAPSPARPARRLTGTAALVAIVVVAVASTITSQLSFRTQLKPLIAAGATQSAGVQVQDPAGLLADCATITQIYRQWHAQILVSFDQPFAYGCAAQTGMNTIYPPYDRRPWLVMLAFRRPVRRILLWGGINCQPPTPLPRTVGVCTPLASGAELLVTPRRPVAATLSMTGVTIDRSGSKARP